MCELPLSKGVQLLRLLNLCGVAGAHCTVLIGPCTYQLNINQGRKVSKSISLVLVALLSACTTVAPTQGYRSAGSTAAPWQIRGELFDITNVKIFINDTKVIDERVSLMSGDGEFRARYDGKNISASCSTSAGLMIASTKCMVFVENEKAATLSF